MVSSIDKPWQLVPTAPDGTKLKEQAFEFVEFGAGGVCAENGKLTGWAAHDAAVGALGEKVSGWFGGGKQGGGKQGAGDASPAPKCDDEDDNWAGRRRRRLQGGGALAVPTAEGAPVAADTEEQIWYEEWQQRFGCWWVALPAPTQAQLGGCLGALGLHLGRQVSPQVSPHPFLASCHAPVYPNDSHRILSTNLTSSRLDAAWSAAHAALGRTPLARAPAPAAAAEQGCKWVQNVELPAFPELPLTLERFQLPPIPRLMPSWQELQSVGGRQVDFGAEDAQPGGRITWGALGAGIALGIAVGAFLAICVHTRTPVRMQVRKRLSTERRP